MFSVELLVNAIVAGLLLGGFYTAVALGVCIAFGLLDVVNIAHPTFVILGSYAAYVTNTTLGWDPILAGALFTPVFFLLGVGLYSVYYHSFEKKGAVFQRAFALPQSQDGLKFTRIGWNRVRRQL